MPNPATVVLLLLALFVLVGVIRSVRIVPQQMAVIIERLGSYSRTLDDGLHLLVPFVDRVRDTIDLREQVVTFPPQPVITSDNLVVSIDTVIYYTVTDAKSAVYEIANYIHRHRAADRHDAAQRHRIPRPGGDVDLPRPDQRPTAGGARPGDGALGHPRQPCRTEGDRPAALGAGFDGETDARRAGQAGRHPHRRGGQAGGHPLCRGRAAGPDPARRRLGPGSGAGGAGAGEGDRGGLRGDPRRRADPGSAGLPVPAGAAAAGPRRCEQDVDHPVGAHRCAARCVQRPRRRHCAVAAASRADPPPAPGPGRFGSGAEPLGDRECSGAGGARAAYRARGRRSPSLPATPRSHRRSRRPPCRRCRRRLSEGARLSRVAG